MGCAFFTERFISTDRFDRALQTGEISAPHKLSVVDAVDSFSEFAQSSDQRYPCGINFLSHLRGAPQNLRQSGMGMGGGRGQVGLCRFRWFEPLRKWGSGPGLPCGFHHDRHGGSLAAACVLNGDGKTFCNHARCLHFMEQHAVAFAIGLEPADRHGCAAVCW